MWTATASISAGLPMPISLVVAGRSDVGCVRSNNEDSFDYRLAPDRHSGIFVVCDGMGGQACGEVASRLAVATVLEYVDHREPDRPLPGSASGSTSDAALLAAAVAEANRAIFAAAIRDADKAGMGTTIVAALVRGDAVAIAHVGDSRAYLHRGDTLQQLTADHSLVMEQVRRGILTNEEAQTSSLQNIILRALGTEENVETDVSDLAAIAGDVLLLCTDGLTRMLSDAEIAPVLAATAAQDLQHACDDLVQKARAAGGEDNITCLLVRFSDSR